MDAGTIRITAKGQVTIPAFIRKKARLLPNIEVEVTCEGETVIVRRAPARTRGGRGSRLIAHMRRCGDGTMTTDEIMALMRGK
jgi:AbrB family looped-hinge helix DNA binding protein